MKKQILMVSLAANIIAFAVNMGINFFLTPYIVSNVGSEAYGFVSLANNFTSYAQILIVALNSMAGRFVTISYHQKRYVDMNKYFTSVVAGNAIMIGVLLIPSIMCILFLEQLINIPQGMEPDIKLLFAFIFASFFLTLINSAFATATFVANRKDIEARINIGSYVMKAMTLILLFAICTPHVFYVGIANLINMGFILVSNCFYTKKLMPEMEFRKKYIDRAKTFELIRSGIWNSIGRLSGVLSEGIDLLITNLFISASSMGTLAIAKMIPGVISSMIGGAGGVFAPSYTIAYANNDKDLLLKHIRDSIFILSMLSNICLVVLIAAGTDFFRLWMPSENADILQLLSVITIAGLAVNGGLQCIFNIYTITNKIRFNSVASIISSFINIVVVFILLNTTDLGVFAVAGVSTVTTILRNLFVSVPYAARCIDIKARVFYKPMIANLTVLFLSAVICKYAKCFFEINNWLILIIFCIGVVAFTAMLNVLAILISDRSCIVNVLNRLGIMDRLKKN